MPPVLNRVRTSVLEITYEESGPADGVPVFLMHGFPYDPRTYDEVVAPLVAAGCRTIVPYLRGYGPTRFLAADTPRSGEQAALGNDLKELIDALGIERAVLAGYDWGGRAACVVAALWPERARTGLGQRLQRPRRRRLRQAGCAGAGAAALVSVLLPHRARPRRIDRQPAQPLQIHLAVVVADLEIRRRDLRANGDVLRQS